MSWELEKTYDNDDVRYISFYVCRGLETIILEVRIFERIPRQVDCWLSLRPIIILSLHTIPLLSEVTLHVSRSRVMMFIDLLLSQSLMFTSMQYIVKSTILKPPDSSSHSRFRVGRTKELMHFSFKSCTLFSPCSSLQFNALAISAECSLISPHG